jgi:glycosyltransferase involved in cell wall biosynthesis
MNKYYCFFPVRDGIQTIGKVMDSLIQQSFKPSKIIVVDDGSTDGTSEILSQYKTKYPDLIEIIRTGSTTRDYKRLPKLWNMSLRDGYEYHMIGAGDVSYEKDYAKKILEYMDNDKNIVVASGDYKPFTSNSPHGAGRFVRQDFFHDIYKDGKYPLIVGYESEILVRVMMKVKKMKTFNNIKFEHLDKLGHGHSFSEFGYGMRSLGYNPAWCVLRCLIDTKRFGLKGTYNIFKSYVTYRPQKSGYYSMFDKELRNFMTKYQSVTVQIKIMNWIVNIFFFNRPIPKYIKKRLRKIALGYKRNKLAKIGISVTDDLE